MDSVISATPTTSAAYDILDDSNSLVAGGETNDLQGQETSSSRQTFSAFVAGSRPETMSDVTKLHQEGACCAMRLLVLQEASKRRKDLSQGTADGNDTSSCCDDRILDLVDRVIKRFPIFCAL